MIKRLDLTGQRFGKLTVLHPAENIGSQTAWVCRCDCGQEAVVRTDNLRYGRTKSCGCQRGAGMELSRLEPGSAETAGAGSGSPRKNNTSGVSGVEWLPGKKRWKATICYRGKRYYLGTYTSFEDAVEARENAEKARRQAEENVQVRFLLEYSNAKVQGLGQAAGHA